MIADALARDPERALEPREGSHLAGERSDRDQTGAGVDPHLAVARPERVVGGEREEAAGQRGQLGFILVAGGEGVGQGLCAFGAQVMACSIFGI